MSLRVMGTTRALTDRWRELPVEPRGSTALGFSFRPLQAEAMGLEPGATLARLLEYPVQVVRLGALWNRIEPEPGTFDTSSLDWQLEAAERAGKQLVVGLGAVKNFGYPEFYAPQHHLRPPLREGTLVTEATHPGLLAAACAFVERVVERYRDRESIIAWQVEHEAVDPLGIEHSWRLAAGFVQREVDTVKQVDPSRPILLNGFLPMSLPVALQQWWRTRDQGDSLSLAESMAEIVALDIYPCHALGAAGGLGVYLDARPDHWRGRARRLLTSAFARGRRVFIAEGQAEPWESVTTPPNPDGRATASCPPERVIENYNRCLRLARQSGGVLNAYLFWGAEYWLLREQGGDPSYVGAFQRVLMKG